MTSALPCVAEVRARFPALSQEFSFFENAGGSQVPDCVIDAMARFFERDNVQTYAGYPASDRCDRVVLEAHAWADHLVGAEDNGRSVLGPSTSALLQSLGWAYSSVLSPGDEIVVSVANHEANIGPWVRLERFGAKIRWWRLDPEFGAPSLAGLEPLLGPRTKLVAMPHTSNLLGDISPVREVCDLAHAVGARVIVDGVAYAPHLMVDVTSTKADFYALSNYKVFGPHMAVLFGRNDAWSGLEGPNHFFVPAGEIPRKFELGCLSYEALAGFLALKEYFQFLTGAELEGRALVRTAYRRIAELEAPILAAIDGYLRSKSGIVVYGPAGAKVPTWGFRSSRVSAPEIATHVNRQGIGMRSGHMYAYRLCEALGIEPDLGVARVSAVHYNSLNDVERLTEALDGVL
ncbi:MAG: aminotransferase class V-fold PLP-dependent enzyme [Fimbriimonadaceae bacterium]